MSAQQATRSSPAGSVWHSAICSSTLGTSVTSYPASLRRSGAAPTSERLQQLGKIAAEPNSGGPNV